MRRDREDQLDLADIGGETGAGPHMGASIASSERKPKGLDTLKPPCDYLVERTRNTRCPATRTR
jgi:hypothetical protein